MATVICPRCHQRLVITIQAENNRLGLLESTHPTPFHSTAQALPANRPQQPKHHQETESPVFLPTFESHVKVPAIQAVLSGLFSAPIAGIVAGAGLYFLEFKTGEIIWGGLAVSGAAFFGIIWWQWFRRSRFYDSLLWRLETIIDADLDNDGQAGPPESVQPHHVSVSINEGQRWQFAEFPGDPKALYTLAQAVVYGDSFSERIAVNAGYTQEDFKNLRDEFISRGLARWNHPTRRQQGVSINRVGRQVLEAIATTPPPDLLA